jgi:hypothetical protein
MVLPSGQLAAVALAALGVGLILSAFVGEGVAALLLGFGIALVVAALITAGMQLLNRNGGAYVADREEA